MPNIGGPKYIKQKVTDLKEEIDNNAIIIDFSNPLSIMDRASRQNISKKTLNLKVTLD